MTRALAEMRSDPAIAPQDSAAPMPRTAFITRAGRHARLADGPTEFLYGYAELARAGQPVFLFEEADLGIAPWGRLAEALSARVGARIGPSPRLTLQAGRALRSHLASFDVLVCTTHSLGLAFSAARQLAGARPRVVVMTMGLIEPEAPRLRRRALARALSGATLAVLSRPEAEWLRAVMPPGLAIRDFVFGPDLGFWTPGAAPAADADVLSVGNDRARDFATLVAAWREEFPRLTIITSLPVTARRANIRVLRGDWRHMLISDPEMREHIRRARLVVVPVRETIQPSGQSFALQAMACGRPVVLSANRGLWDAAQLRRHEACRLVPPGDPAALAEAVAALLARPAEAEAMGARARRMLEVEHVSSEAMARQVRSIAAAVEPGSSSAAAHQSSEA